MSEAKKSGTRMDARKRFFSDQSAVAFMQSVIKNPHFETYMEMIHSYAAPFSPEMKLEDIPHKQSQIDGGIKAWSKLNHLLWTKAFDDRPQHEEDDGEKQISFRKPVIK